jgi:multidrug efflux pump subunit AcrB
MVLLTNLTNIVALTPLSLGLGFAGEIFKPLAVVQIGGNLAAMILTLLVIPAVYVLVRRRRRPAVVPETASE